MGADDHAAMTWSYAVYGAWFAAWATLELFGLARKRSRVPWLTLSETVWSLDRHRSWLRLVFAAGFGILTVHLASPGWP